MASTTSKRPPPDEKRARARFEKTCNRKPHARTSGGDVQAILAACAKLTVMARDGRGGDKNSVLAARAAAIACNALELRGFSLHLVPTAEIQRARGEACFILGHAALKGDGLPKNEADAARAFKDGCELKHRPSCEASEANKK